MSNTPTIRFKGYGDSWESHLLGNISEYSKGQGYSKNDLLEEGNPIILYGRLYTQYESTISEVDTFAEPHAGSVFSTGREVIIPASGETAEDIARASFVKQPGVLLGGDLNVLTPEQRIDPGFLALAISNGNARRELSVRAQGKTVVHIHNDDIKEVHVSIPSDKAEQEIITEYLGQIDKLIISQQRKCEKLIALKAACLDKMFPKKGSKVPELRFAGFAGEWEPRKLGDLAIFNPKAELPEEFEYVDLESVVGTEMLSHRTENRRTAPSRAQRLAQTGDLFYQTVRPYQKNNYLFEKSDKHYVFSTGYAQMRPLADGRFVLCLVQNDGFVKVVLENCTGTSYPAINSNDLAKIEVYSPGDSKEQNRIGDFFKGIDDLITLHQRKLEKLRQFKQAMMHNMFV